MPPVPLDFDTGWVRMEGVVLRTPPIPRPMEAALSFQGIGGIGEGRVRARAQGREVYSLPGELRGGACRLRFRLRLESGVNEIALVFSGGTPVLDSAAYRIHDAIGPKPGGIWTHPIVRMDQTNPRWIGVVRDKIASLVRTFDIDAIHLDAGNVRRQSEAPIHEALAEALPHTLFGCEYLSELGHFFFHLTQGGSLPPEGPRRLTDLGWRLSDPYLRSYYHLCKAEAFVPAVKVCDQEPVKASLSGEERALAERQWELASTWHLVPNIRVNYRDYGLDSRTCAALAEVLSPGRRSRRGSAR
jgi:hypothetical protein